jgi:hypothetical protein
MASPNIDKVVHIRYIYLLARRAYSWLFQLTQMWKLLAPGIGLVDFLTPAGYIGQVEYLLIFRLFVTFSRRVSKKNMHWMSPDSSMATFPCFRSLPSNCLVSLSLNKCVMYVWAILLVSEWPTQQFFSYHGENKLIFNKMMRVGIKKSWTTSLAQG